MDAVGGDKTRVVGEEGEEVAVEIVGEEELHGKSANGKIINEK